MMTARYLEELYGCTKTAVGTAGTFHERLSHIFGLWQGCAAFAIDSRGAKTFGDLVKVGSLQYLSPTGGELPFDIGESFLLPSAVRFHFGALVVNDACSAAAFYESSFGSGDASVHWDATAEQIVCGKFVVEPAWPARQFGGLLGNYSHLGFCCSVLGLL